MPLRDHFRPPLLLKHSWDKLHGGWPMVIVQHLFKKLPEGFMAAPNVHLGAAFEVDITTHRADGPEPVRTENGSNGGVATVVWAPPAPTLMLEAELPEQDEYEVLI